MVLALPVADLRLGLPNAGQDPTGTVSRTSYDLLATAYTPGLNGPFVAVVEGETGRIHVQAEAAVQQITALPAAVIMIAVFAGFLFSHDTMIGPIGFAMGIGVLFDALVVRMTLTPADMALLGRHAWWLPAPLERLMPHVDIEGETLPEPAAPNPSRRTAALQQPGRHRGRDRTLGDRGVQRAPVSGASVGTTPWWTHAAASRVAIRRRPRTAGTPAIRVGDGTPW
ncbi:MMPL family transporter [Nocardia sp. NPDC004654]|uniref:MMPL family transporter n=1 Tax=Nocardia sp. NPDC004654 TaxID=3154776 RepID=UPI0033BFB3E4